MKRLLAGALTASIMALLLWSGARRTPSGSQLADDSVPASDSNVLSAPGAHPAEARVRSLMKSAVGGDVSAYLDAFSGTLRQRLDREVNERGREAFATDLRKASATRKSHALFAAELDGENAARVTVESVYPDRNERQTYRVERIHGGWFVADVETVRSHQPQSKFGTSASYIAPEGVPVQGAATAGTSDGLDPSAGEDATATP